MQFTVNSLDIFIPFYMIFIVNFLRSSYFLYSSDIFLYCYKDILVIFST